MKTLAVAERIMVSAQRDMWALADAVLADIPAVMKGTEHRSTVDSGTVPEQLDVLTTILEQHGITKADGSPYTSVYLRNLRDTAMAWMPDDRRTEASFDAHREHAGETRPVFVALCRYAAGEKVRRPADVEVQAWSDAVEKIATRRHGYKVQSQAARIACGKKAKNVPNRLDRATFAELCNGIAELIRGIERWEDKFSNFLVEDRADRARFRGLLADLIQRAEIALQVVGAEVTDEAIAELSDGAK
jgi:hypothetical protein